MHYWKHIKGCSKWARWNFLIWNSAESKVQHLDFAISHKLNVSLDGDSCKPPSKIVVFYFREKNWSWELPWHLKIYHCWVELHLVYYYNTLFYRQGKAAKRIPSIFRQLKTMTRSLAIITFYEVFKCLFDYYGHQNGSVEVRLLFKSSMDAHCIRHQPFG